MLDPAIQRLWSARLRGKRGYPLLFEGLSRALPLIPAGAVVEGFYEVDRAREVAEWVPVKKETESEALPH
jgi:hypothetical protein